MVQTTWRRDRDYRSKFRAGTGPVGRPFTILRDTHLGQRRRDRREVEDVDGVAAGAPRSPAGRERRIGLAQMRAASNGRRAEQRETPLLAVVFGLIQEAAARTPRAACVTRIRTGAGESPTSA